MSAARYCVARQDYQVQEWAWFLLARPRRKGHDWEWTNNRNEALELDHTEALQLAGQYNSLPDAARRGSVARVEMAE
jgi:hypothetical protein